MVARSNPSQVPPLLMHVEEVTACDTGHQEVGTCSTSGGSQGMYITFTTAKKKSNKAEPTPKLKTQRRCYPKSKIGVPLAPQKGNVCPPKTFKKNDEENLHMDNHVKCPNHWFY